MTETSILVREKLDQVLQQEHRFFRPTIGQQTPRERGHDRSRRILAPSLDEWPQHVHGLLVKSHLGQDPAILLDDNRTLARNLGGNAQ